MDARVEVLQHVAAAQGTRAVRLGGGVEPPRHPDVAETAVVGRPDGVRGQVAVAHTVPRTGGDQP
ncbi:AMP-binding enzyme [Streptomyces eurythermus]